MCVLASSPGPFLARSASNGENLGVGLGSRGVCVCVCVSVCACVCARVCVRVLGVSVHLTCYYNIILSSSSAFGLTLFH